MEREQPERQALLLALQTLVVTHVAYVYMERTLKVFAPELFQEWQQILVRFLYGGVLGRHAPGFLPTNSPLIGLDCLHCILVLIASGNSRHSMEREPGGTFLAYT